MSTKPQAAQTVPQEHYRNLALAAIRNMSNESEKAKKTQDR